MLDAPILYIDAQYQYGYRKLATLYASTKAPYINEEKAEKRLQFAKDWMTKVNPLDISVNHLLKTSVIVFVCGLSCCLCLVPNRVPFLS